MLVLDSFTEDFEASRCECPLGLKEAVSSVCFAAPRCDPLPELQQVQPMFASKNGKEFCGVNPQLVDMLSHENFLDASPQLEEVLRPASVKALGALRPNTELVQNPVNGHESIPHHAPRDPNAPEYLNYHSLPLVSDASVGVQEVVAAANAAVEAAERAAAAARLVAVVAQLRITQLSEKTGDLNNSVFSLFDGHVSQQHHLPSMEDDGVCSCPNHFGSC